MSCIMCVMVLASFLTFVRLVRNAFSQVASFWFWGYVDVEFVVMRCLIYFFVLGIES